MPRLTELHIGNYRSIKEEIRVKFPDAQPLVLLGENNAGKSNIVKALDLVLGEGWPGSHEPDDHEFWGRDPNNDPIAIRAYFDGLAYVDTQGRPGSGIEHISWKCDPRASGERCQFRAVLENGEEKWVNKPIREKCICVVVGADRRLSYQLSYSTRWTLLSKLMRKFHQHLTSDQTKVTRLKEKYEELKVLFDQVPEFADFQKNLREQFDAVLTGMTYGLRVDFSAYDPSDFFHSLRVMPQEGDQPRAFDEIGTGEEQILALVFAHAYAKAFYGGVILVIEEPEAHLHPLAQQWLSRVIRKMTKDGLQVIITTHSPEFVDILGLEGVTLVSKVNNATIVKQLSAQDLASFCLEHGARPERTSAHTVLPFYANGQTSEILAGLFGKKVVLVEGQTEQFSMPIYLEKVGLDVLKEGISIIPVMGKGNIAKWWRFFKAYDIPVFLTFDNDAEDDKDANKRQDALKTIGVTGPVVNTLVSTEDWIIGNSYCIFGRNFEHTLRKSFADYSTREKEAESTLGSAKPLVARYVAQRLVPNGEVGWEKLRELREMIERVT